MQNGTMLNLTICGVSLTYTITLFNGMDKTTIYMDDSMGLKDF